MILSNSYTRIAD